MHIMNGNELKILRIRRRITQQKLADKVGLSNQMISYYESGRYRISKFIERALREELTP